MQPPLIYNISRESGYIGLNTSTPKINTALLRVIKKPIIITEVLKIGDTPIHFLQNRILGVVHVHHMT